MAQPRGAWSASDSGLPSTSFGITALAIDPVKPSRLYALTNVGKWSVQRISVPDGKLDLVADLTNVHFTGALGPWFGLDPNDNPVLLRDNGTSDIYALTFERK